MSIIKRSAVVTALLVGALMAPTPVYASAANGVIGGADVLTDDWGDEGSLSMNQHRHSYAVGLWQWVLRAQAAKKPDGTFMDFDDIDCDFGPTTKFATIDLQKSFNLKADGIVGAETFSFFDNNLSWGQGSPGWIMYSHPDYPGSSTGGLMRVDGQYRFPIDENWTYRTAYYHQGSGGC